MGDVFKRKNSFSVLYIQGGKANPDDVVELLEIFDIEIEDLIGIQKMSKKELIVKLKDSSSDKFERLIKEFDGKILPLEKRNLNVKIVNIS